MERGGELFVIAAAYETELDAMEAAEDLAKETGRVVNVLKHDPDHGEKTPT